MGVISKYASMVKFTHTIFALPFALTAYVYALESTDTTIDWMLFVKIVLCMVFARNAAMGFNRWADRRIDSLNDRTAKREIPAGTITPRAAMTFVVVNSVLFIAATAWINTLCLILSPLALTVLLGYSYTKRFTALSHIVLGLSLAIAPSGAYIAVTGTLTLYPVLLSALVLTWSAGFDILYSMQDAGFDRKHSLHSIPAKFSPSASKIISIGLHLITSVIAIILTTFFDSNVIYYVGTAIFIISLCVQHIIYRPSKVDLIGSTFGLVNGFASVTYATFAISAMLL